MAVCYECFKEAEITELVIFEEDENWKLGCVQCVKPKKLYNIRVQELREETEK